MEIQIRHYDRILMLNLDGVVTEPDLVQISGFINTIASRINSVIFDVHGARLETAVFAALTRLKKQYERNKLKFLIVSPTLAGADKTTLFEAVDSINTPDGARLIEIFAQEVVLKQAQTQLQENRSQLLLKLGVTGDSSTPLEPAIHALEDRHEQLRQLYKTLASEILHLRGNSEISMPEADNPGVVRSAEAKRRALDAVLSSGELD